MKPEAQRIAIAEACGWKFTRIEKYICGQTYEIVSPNGNESDGWRGPTYRTSHSATGEDSNDYPFRNIEEVLQYGGIPDYLADLNAMHEAAEFLSDCVFVKDDDGQRTEKNCYLTWLYRICGGQGRAVDATAAQRAEAFLKTLGLWKD